MRDPLIVLTNAERERLLLLRNRHSLPYIRERAAAILKLSEGLPLAVIARNGLLRPHARQTIRRWMKAFKAQGAEGLFIREGRGRRPSFFPPD